MNLKMILVVVCIPFICFSQKSENIFVQIENGFLFDVFEPEMDINPFSPDMQSNFNGIDDVLQGIKYTIGYKLSEKLSVGINIMDADIAGSNNIESYQTNFNERNVLVNYDLINIYNYKFYTHISYGKIEFSSKRKLVYDGYNIPTNCENCNSDKYSYGVGLSTRLSEYIEVGLNFSRNIVTHDGFDGWDYGSNKDEYLYRSLSLRINLN